MSTPKIDKKTGWQTIGVVGAACLACCAGPLLAAIGGVGAVGSLAAFVLWPAAGLVLAALTAATLVTLRRRHSPARSTVPVRRP